MYNGYCAVMACVAKMLQSRIFVLRLFIAGVTSQSPLILTRDLMYCKKLQDSGTLYNNNASRLYIQYCTCSSIVSRAISRVPRLGNLSSSSKSTCLYLLKVMDTKLRSSFRPIGEKESLYSSSRSFSLLLLLVLFFSARTWSHVLAIL